MAGKSRNKKHGMSKTRIYTIWLDFKKRCNNPKNKDYPKYGGRNIGYAPEWQEFKVFYEWALLNGYQEHLTLERINVNGNYEPKNCKWATRSEQARNKTNSIHIEFNGITKIQQDWAKVFGVDHHTIQAWRQKGIIQEKFEKHLHKKLGGN